MKKQNIDYWKNWDNLKELTEDILNKAKTQGATSCEVSISMNKGLNARVRLSEIDTMEFQRGKSIGITTYSGKKQGSATLSDLSKPALNDAINAALKIAEQTEVDEYSGLADADLMATDIQDLNLFHPKEIESNQAIEFAKQCEQAALQYSDKIYNSEGATFSKSNNIYVYGNSHGFIGLYPSSMYSMALSVIAKEHKNSDDMQRDFDYTVSRSFEGLKTFDAVGENCAKKTLSKLNARKIATCNAPVIFIADIASSLFSSFISAISGSNQYRKSSFLLDSLNSQVFPGFLQIVEDPFILKGFGSCAFDSEGVATKKRSIVTNGIVNSYILSSYSARKLGMETTGNAGGVHNLFINTSLSSENASESSGNALESSENLPLSSRSNNLNQTNSLTFQQLLKTMNKGLLVTELMGHGVNIVTGDYSQGAFGFWIENGEIQYPVHEITIASNLKDMFKNIVTISNDVDKRKSIQTGSVLISEMIIAGN